MGDEDDEERELSIPDILTVRASVAVLSDTVNYEFAGSSREGIVKPKEPEVSDEAMEDDVPNIINNMIPLDLVYIKSELDPLAEIDEKITLCNRRIVKSVADEEVITMKREMNDSSTNDTYEMNAEDNTVLHSSVQDWKISSFNITDWIADQATKILLEEEGTLTTLLFKVVKFI